MANELVSTYGMVLHQLCVWMDSQPTVTSPILGMPLPHPRILSRPTPRFSGTWSVLLLYFSSRHWSPTTPRCSAEIQSRSSQVRPSPDSLHVMAVK